MLTRSEWLRLIAMCWQLINWFAVIYKFSQISLRVIAVGLNWTSVVCRQVDHLPIKSGYQGVEDVANSTSGWPIPTHQCNQWAITKFYFLFLSSKMNHRFGCRKLKANPLFLHKLAHWNAFLCHIYFVVHGKEYTSVTQSCRTKMLVLLPLSE